jgi:hypothetical protein
MKVELVVIEGVYAIRRTSRTFFGLFAEVEYLDFQCNLPEWRKRTYDYFGNCLTNNLDKARERLAKNGSDLGTPYSPGVIPMDEFMAMSELATTDEGMKDLMLKAREFYLLKKKSS